MRWDIEELLETALSEYLIEQVEGEINVYAAWGMDEPKYPCAIVHVSGTQPTVEAATWHDARMCSARVAIITEIAPETDDNGITVLTPRDRNARARSLVLNVLCSDGLLAALQAKIIERDDQVAVSMAQVASVTREIEPEERRFVSVVEIESIIEPVTGSTWSNG
jgi:hypothetical protein